MSKRYPGGLITKTPVVPTTSAAPGVWTLDQAIRYILAGTWPRQPIPVIAVAYLASPYVNVYPWSAGFGTKYANPATLPTDFGFEVAFNPADTAIAVAHDVTPYISTYPWSAGFGTKYANPATLPDGQGSDVAFNSTGNTIAVANATTTYITAYPWSAGFGTKYANPATLPTGQGLGVTFFG